MIGKIMALRRLVMNQRLTQVELEALREKRLRAVIRNAYEHVPYYRSLFRSEGISPDEIRTVDDLRKVPVTSKNDLRAGGVERIASEWADLSKCIPSTTSGSSGQPFTVYRTQDEFLKRRLLILAALISIGYGPTDKLMLVGPQRPEKKEFYTRLGLFREEALPLSMPFEEQIRRMKDFQPSIMWGYTSAIRALIHDLGYPLRELVDPKILITSAEVCDAVLKKRLETDLDAEIFDFYLAEECGLIAWECPAHNGLHLNSDHFILELGDRGEPSGSGGAGAAFVTSLYGFVMPFIRYDLGDLIVLSDKKCSCGCSFPLIEHPIGREDDVLILPSGKILSTMQFTWILEQLPAIDQWQVIQESEQHFVLKLVMGSELGQESIQTIQARFLDYFAEPVRLDIQFVDYMEHESGKFKSFISKVA
jgi:phenylacetate-CoA ligase